jgi:Domain of Unknown Function (DUF928)
MAKMTRKLHWTATAALSIALGVVLPVLPSYSIKFRPKTVLQRPGSRQGAATRGDCAQKDPLMFKAILPTTNQGQTVADYPTFYWYQANQAFSWMRFELYATQNQQPESFPLYSSTFRIKGGSNQLASLTLPENAGLSPLEVNREYLWKVTLICSKGGPEDDIADGSQQSIQGWVTRVASSPTLDSQLVRAKHPYDAYAAEGLWYDAVHDLATRLQEDPQDEQLVSDWKDLLTEMTLGAKSVSPKPLFVQPLSTKPLSDKL